MTKKALSYRVSYFLSKKVLVPITKRYLVRYTYDGIEAQYHLSAHSAQEWLQQLNAVLADKHIDPADSFAYVIREIRYKRAEQKAIKQLNKLADLHDKVNRDVDVFNFRHALEQEL